MFWALSKFPTMPNLLSKFLVVALLFSFANVDAQQNRMGDLTLIQAQDFEDGSLQDYKPTYIFKNSNAIVKYNPVSVALGGFMFTYQKFISVQISSDCMYHESCSKFGVSSIRAHGALKGTFLAADRLMRCNRSSTIDIWHDSIDEDSGKILDATSKYKMDNAL